MRKRYWLVVVVLLTAFCVSACKKKEKAIDDGINAVVAKNETNEENTNYSEDDVLKELLEIQEDNDVEEEGDDEQENVDEELVPESTNEIERVPAYTEEEQNNVVSGNDVKWINYLSVAYWGVSGMTCVEALEPLEPFLSEKFYAELLQQAEEQDALQGDRGAYEKSWIKPGEYVYTRDGMGELNGYMSLEAYREKYGEPYDYDRFSVSEEGEIDLPDMSVGNTVTFEFYTMDNSYQIRVTSDVTGYTETYQIVFEDGFVTDIKEVSKS